MSFISIYNRVAHSFAFPSLFQQDAAIMFGYALLELNISIWSSLIILQSVNYYHEAKRTPSELDMSYFSCHTRHTNMTWPLEQQPIGYKCQTTPQLNLSSLWARSGGGCDCSRSWWIVRIKPHIRICSLLFLSEPVIITNEVWSESDSLPFFHEWRTINSKWKALFEDKRHNFTFLNTERYIFAKELMWG